MTTPHIHSDDDSDFQQLSGALDRPVAPAPSFAESLKARAVQTEAGERSSMKNVSTITSVSRHASSTGSMQIPKRDQRTSFVDVVAAAVLIIALLGGAFVFNRIRIDDASPSNDPPSLRLAALSTPGTIASPSVPTPVNDQPGTESVARGGSLGSTSERSLVNPDLTRLTGPQSLKWSHVVSDPLWVMPYGDVVASLGSSELAVQDATTGEVLWSASTSDAFRNSQYDTAGDPGLLFGVRAGPMALPWIEGNTLYYVTTTELVGVDLRSGTEVMRAPHYVPEVDSGPLRLPWEMSVSDGVAYILSSPVNEVFTVTAIDLESGEQSWQHQIGEPTGPIDASSSTVLHLVVARNLVMMQVWDDENTILALNAPDGSVAWEEPNAIANASLATSYGNISAIDDDYLVVTQKGHATGALNGTPNADNSLRIALYNLDDGSVVWTAREGSGSWTMAGHATDSCRVIPGWDETALFVPCSDENAIHLYRLPFDGDGEAEHFGSWPIPAPVYGDSYDGEAAYFNAGTSLLRIDLATGEQTNIPLQGGSTCAGAQATDSTLICINDDSLGTYTVQAYGSATDATPNASPVQAQATPRSTP